MKYYFCVILINFTLNVLTIYGLASCPAPNIDITPCECIEDRTGIKPSTIRCSGDQILDLMTIFEVLNANVGPEDKKFDIFYLNNTEVKEIGENVFKEFKFNDIYIENTNQLSKVDSNAFNGLEESVKYIHIRNTKLNLNSVNNSDFDAFRRLKNVEILDFSSTYCPSDHIIGPKCRCDFKTQPSFSNQSTVISCKSISNAQELTKVFTQLSEGLAGNQRNFYQFRLYESNIDELPQNVFNGITFADVVIEDCPQLNTIDKNIFSSIESFVNRLTISNINLGNDSDTLQQVWYALSSLTNLVQIDLVNVFNEIPDKAFKAPVVNTQSRLKYFSHSGYETTNSKGARIKSVGRYAFYALPNIEVINLQNNVIESIDKYGFANQMSSDRQLLIRLAKNHLNHNSFTVGSLAGSRRPMLLELGKAFVGCNRDILYLEETVFSPFLDKEGNQLEMGCSYTMQCDCNMKWLYDCPHFWRDSIKSGPFGDLIIPCETDNEDGVEEMSIWDLPEDHFDCHSNNVNTNIKVKSDGSSDNSTIDQKNNEIQDIVEEVIEIVE